MTLKENTGEPAIVTIAERSFTLAPISLNEELLLTKKWEAIAHEDDEARNKRAYRIIMQAPTPFLQSEGMKEMVAQAKQGEPLSDHAVYVEARQSVRGIIAELFARTRKAHPEVTEADIEAIVNEKNAGEAFSAMTKALAAMNPKDPTP